jgi:hypothetical protein
MEHSKVLSSLFPLQLETDTPRSRFLFASMTEKSLKSFFSTSPTAKPKVGASSFEIAFLLNCQSIRHKSQQVLAFIQLLTYIIIHPLRIPLVALVGSKAGCLISALFFGFLLAMALFGQFGLGLLWVLGCVFWALVWLLRYTFLCT